MKNQERLARNLVLLVMGVVVATAAFCFWNAYVNTMIMKIPYQEGGSVSFEVALKENNYYDSNNLAYTNEYITELIDRIAVNLTYRLGIDEEIDFSYKYKIILELVVKNRETENSIYVWKEDILEEQAGFSVRGIEINETVWVDYDRYNRLANEFLEEYDLTNKTANLITVGLYVAVDCAEDRLCCGYKRISGVEVPLNKLTTGINCSNMADDGDRLIEIVPPKTVSERWIFSGVMLLILDLLLLGLLILLKMRNKTDQEKFAKKMNRILSNYDSLISVLETEHEREGYEVIIVSEFDNLLDIRELTKNPILMYRDDINLYASFSILTSDKILYRYEINGTGSVNGRDAAVIFNEAEGCSDFNRREPEISEVIEAAKLREEEVQGGRKDFLFRELIHNIPLRKLDAYYGAGNYECLPDEVYWQLCGNIERWQVEKHIVKTYIGTDGRNKDEIARESCSGLLFRGSVASTSLVALVIHSKFVELESLEHISEVFKTSGVYLSKEILANWILWTAERYFLPVYHYLDTRLREGQFQSGEVPVKLLYGDGLEDGKKTICVRMTDGRISPRIVVYEYRKSGEGGCVSLTDNQTEYNGTEEALRDFSAEGKGWVFVDAARGAQASMVIYSVVETAKANGLNVLCYIRYLLTELSQLLEEDGNMTYVKLEAYMPWSVGLPEECHIFGG